MTRQLKYTDVDGQELPLVHLDAEERKLVADLRRRAKSHPDWDDFDNYWPKKVAAFYDARGMPRKESSETVVFRIAQDLSSRLGLAAGLMSLSDYRGDLEEIIRERFGSLKEFCQATGLPEDLIKQVLAGRKDLSLDTLE